MRGSIPTLNLLALLSALSIVNSKTLRKAPLILILIIGLITPMGEIMRGITSPRIANSNLIDTKELIYKNPGLFPQYFIPYPHSKFSSTKIYNVSDFKFNTFGSALFDTNALAVSSQDCTDAAIVSNALPLPKGIYKIIVTVSNDVQSYQKIIMPPIFHNMPNML
jgi:hypothetical protein